MSEISPGVSLTRFLNMVASVSRTTVIAPRPLIRMNRLCSLIQHHRSLWTGEFFQVTPQFVVWHKVNFIIGFKENPDGK